MIEVPPVLPHNPARDDRHRPSPPQPRAARPHPLHLFSQRGYFNTSIHDIQREAGVSIGSIYNHFGGKETVAQALYDDLPGRMQQLVDDICGQHATRAGRVGQIRDDLSPATS